MEEVQSPAGGRRLFILDIGTRSVVGVAGHKEGEIFVVEAWDIEPHARRAMIDGQIEDIGQVAKVAGAVKTRIEEKLGTRFDKVSVAAAGRALKTCRATAAQDIPTVPITPQMAFSLENEAINTARTALDEERGDVPYYCVGHSVVRYTLDGYPFTTILGHRASRAEVEIIATFLPAEVVESLRGCMNLLGLEIDTMTLEPIAAMRAVIPQDLRLLNLALVDIGAGTSDIALSADSSVSGYTMATVAGDEVTETIIKKYLVDFATAEKLKLALENGGPYTFTDILGFDHETREEELLQTIQPAIEFLAQVIADKIVDCNAGPPAAAFMVGGGSKVPGLCAELAQRLGLESNKVALAGTQFSGKLLNEDSGLDGPEFATPVGIALIAADNAEVEGPKVTINGEKVRLFAAEATSVMDALLMGGYRYSDLMGRNGRSLTFALNGVRTVVRGEPYTAAELTLNGKPASLSAPVESGDAIGVVKATSGADAEATIADYAGGGRPIRVVLNGTPLLAGLVARVNGTVATPDTPILDQDNVELYNIRTVAELCDAGKVPWQQGTITVNGQAADAETALHDADEVVCLVPGAVTPRPEVVPASPVEGKKIPAANLSAPVEESPEPEAVPAPVPEPVVETPPAVAPAPKPAPQEPAASAEPMPTPQATATPEPQAAAETETATEAEPGPMAPAEPEKPVEPEPAPGAEPKTTAQAAEPAAPPQAGPQPDTAAEPELTPQPTPEAETAPAPEPAAQDEPAPAAEAPTQSEPQSKPEPELQSEPGAEPQPTPAAEPTPIPFTPAGSRSLRIDLNGKTVVLPPKPGGEPHRLFDMLTLVDIDPKSPKGMVKVLVNGQESSYLEELVSGDKVEIGWETNER